MLLEEVAVAVKPAGADGAAAQGAAEVSALACDEGADAPSASMAFTT
jgi:hypothetical protein